MKNSNLKKAAALLLATGILFTTSCSGKKTSTADGVVAQPDGREYTFTYPSDWSVLREDSMYAIESPALTTDKVEKNANISIMSAVIHEDSADYYEISEGELLDAYVPQYMDMVKAEFGSMVFDGEIEEVTVSGKDARRVSYSYTDPFTEEEFFFETVFALLKTNAYCHCYYITYTANGKNAYDEFIGGFEKVVSTFDFN